MAFGCSTRDRGAGRCHACDERNSRGGGAFARPTLPAVYRLGLVARSTAPAAALLALALIASCASYVGRSGEIRAALEDADYDRALAAAESIDRSNSKLLYLYETGLVLHCQGDYEGSSRALAESERVLEDLYTKSVTRETASLVVSETIAPYRGDAFEAVYVNYYQIMNYLAMNDVEGAMVECRRVNRKLQMLSDAGEGYFSNDPFLQYLTAMVYDLGREREEAGVSYRVAAGLYDDGEFATAAPLAPSFFCDAAANAVARGDREEAEAYAARARCRAGADSGRVTLLVECGQIVRKRESSLVLPILESDRWSDDEDFAHELSTRHGQHYDRRRVKYWLKVALPVLEVLPARYTGVELRAHPVAGGHASRVQAGVAADLDARAGQAFREKESTVLIRAIVRAIAKYLAHEKADDQDEGLGALVNILNIATETADTRSWSTLPARIYLARLDLPAGRYRIEADLLGPDGKRAGSVVFDGVAVAGGTHVVRSARAF